MRVISGLLRGTKLYTLEGNNTRPTLDRVKESLFSIIQNSIRDANVLDLFAGSGALAIETLSRGAKKAILCDSSYEAIQIINKNIQKTKLEDKSTVMAGDYTKCLKKLNEKFDIIFIDPPYEKNIAIDAVNKIAQLDLLSETGIIIIETDQEDRELKGLNNISYINIYDLRKYGRVKLIFLNRKG